MKTWIAFSSILGKDMSTYYLKPPNISWGIIFPLAWALMFFLRTGEPMDVREILPGIMSLSILFGTTSMLAVTITFERRRESFNRLLLAPLDLNLLMLAKTSGAILFGIVNGFVPVLIAFFLTDLGGINWVAVFLGVVLISITSTFMGLFIAVAVREVFEAQTFSNFFRFPMIFLCGLFIPLETLPIWIRPLSYILPLTYGADLLREAVNGWGYFHPGFSLAALLAFALGLFLYSIRNVKMKWID